MAWNSDPVHETLILQPGVITEPLKGNILHNTFQTVKQYEEKMKQYAQKGAENIFSKERKDGWWKQIVSPLLLFFRNYIIRFRFLDGKEGFWLAWSTAVYTYNKYKRTEPVDPECTLIVMTNFIPHISRFRWCVSRERLNLHIFESRYKQLIAECFEQKKTVGHSCCYR